MKYSLVKTVVLGLWLASHLLHAQCDSLRMAHAGQWYSNGDTLHIQGGFLTAYPRIGTSYQSGYPTLWYWFLSRIAGSGQSYYVASGSLSGTTGSSVTLNVQLDYAYHPTFYHLTLIAHVYAPGGTFACTDSALIVIRGDTLPPNPWAGFCRDSILLQIGGQQVRPQRSVSLPLGSYPFSLNRTGDFRGWWLTGPSPAQHRPDNRNLPAGTILDTAHFTAPGTHYLRIYFYNGICFDTLTYIIHAYNPNPNQNCANSGAFSPCLPQLTVNNATYLPGQVITLANGTYTFHLAPAANLPPSTSPSYQYYWQICGANLPGGCLSGQGSTITVPIGLASYFLQVISMATWLCPTTQVCTDTVTFVLSGGGTPNDTVIVSYPNDSTPYFPGDTIPLDLDTTCLYAGVLVPYPDSIYWWYWTYYGPTGIPLDSGITPIACVYPTQPGVYTLVYGLTPPPTGRTAQSRQYSFYLRFGGRTANITHTDAFSTPSLYPNPSSGLVWLALPNEGVYQITIREVLGREVRSLTLPGGGAQLLSLNLPAGFYLVEVEGGGKRHTLRLLLE
ncbi:MAG: T9SS type A sorting domain-containing protein [Bacteroidia bacterium]|nr:T9SS type A sorting domain-containing protein [Bacteroidia bacterium]